jgi:UDP-N-acetylmuramoylalanine--D-glutamate ligase
MDIYQDMNLVGMCNVENVMAAIAIAEGMGVPMETILKVIKTFRAVEHRIEFVREIDHVKYYNDSKGTNTDATVTALKAFDHNVILLIGGFEKGLAMDDVKAHLGCVKKVIGFGACGPRLVRETVGDDGIVVETLDEAVAAANEIALPGDTILLSPTTSSYDQYSCFEERGEHFKRIVNALEE